MHAQADLDRLLAAATQYAREKLAKHGNFFPFGAAIRTTGEVKLIATQSMIPADEVPDSADLSALCRSAMGRKRDHLRAAAVISAVRAEHEIRIELEHHEGISLSVLLPYTRKRLVHSVSLGAPEVQQSAPQIWA